MAKLPVVFKHGTREEYDSLTQDQVVSNALYFLDDTGEILHGSRNLAKGNHYQVEFDAEKDTDDIAAINRVIEEVRVANGLASLRAVKEDIAVVTHVIANDKKSYTSYVYDGNNWAAMDGNYNASNVYFDEDIMITTAVGNIGLTNGSANIPAAGKNIKQVFEALWTKENYNPKVTNPSISLSVSANAEGEVGTAFEAPTATATITGFGKFEFGSKDVDGKFYAANAASDVVFSSLKVGLADTAANLSTDASEITDIAADDTVNYISYNGNSGTFTDAVQTQKFSASAAHGGSARKGVSNLGNFVNTSSNGVAADYESAGKGIAANAGTMTKNGTAVFTATGYRAWFMGMLNSIPSADEVTSAFIHENLTKKGKLATQTFEIKPGEAGAKCVLIAIPASAGSLTAAILTSSMNTDIIEDYKKNMKTVQVTDASEVAGTEVAYNVYWYKPAALASDEVHSLTVTKK